jgi:hypothetical protein
MNKKVLLDLVFSDWDIVEKYLIKHGFSISKNDECVIIQKDSFKVGLDWESTGYTDRRNMLMLVLFQGYNIIDVTYKDIGNEIKRRKIKLK